MIISRTPYRISLFGGGTDYPAWYRGHGGAVIGTTINKYCYVSIRCLPPFFEHRHRIVYSKIELPNTVDEIQHPAVRAVLKETGINSGVEIQHHGDLPARSGMGSSCAFTVGLLHAVRAFQGRMASPRWLADEGTRIEQEVIRENVGSQDQIWAAFGGTNVITFQKDGSYAVHPVVLSPERRRELESHMLLFFTRFTRVASSIAEKTIARLPKKTRQLNRLRQMVDEAAEVLTNPCRSVAEIGPMLHDSWLIKKDLTEEVSTPLIDMIYESARSAGALGGKLLGAGGGGFMVLIAKPQDHQRIREKLRGFIEVTFQIGSSGSRIVMYEPDELER
jgi:D-glycero-alpha-D-manno-heptose-7-phosphate kinase